MAMFVEVNSTDKGCKVILNVDEVMEIAPMQTGGCHLFLTDGRIYKVSDSYTLFQQFAMQTVSSEDIAKQVKDLNIPGVTLIDEFKRFYRSLNALLIENRRYITDEQLAEFVARRNITDFVITSYVSEKY